MNLLTSPQARHREMRAFALCSVLALGLFTVWPTLDLTLSRALYAGQFVHADKVWVRALYEGVPWLTRGLALYLLLRLLAGRWRLSRPHWRRLWVSLLLLVLVAGAVVHGPVKQFWSRPRPVQLLEFGGSEAYSSPLRPAGLNPGGKRYSFVSGHAASGFALLAPALFAAPARRRWWGRAALSLGLLFGLGRMLQGGHFLSDVLFAGLLVWGSALLIRQLWLLGALRRLRTSDSEPWTQDLKNSA